MRTLYTVAFPALSMEDSAWIEAFRREHDPQHDLIAAHFTLLFGCTDVADDAYLRHVETACRGIQSFKFACRSAVLGTDQGRGYVYLVPDEGSSSLSGLHDALYGGLMQARLRLDLPFTPHMTIASCADPSAARSMCGRLNEQGLDIRGAIDALTVISVEDGAAHSLKTFELGAIRPLDAA